MGKIVRASAVALAVAFLFTLLVPTIPSNIVFGANFPDYFSADIQSDQYSSQIVFNQDALFGRHSFIVQVDPWTLDFALGDLNDDDLEDMATISNFTNDICIYNRTTDGYFESQPWRLSNPAIMDLRSIVIGDILAKDGLDDIAISYNDSYQGKIAILNQSSAFSVTKSLPTMAEPYELALGVFSNNDNCLAVVCRGDASANYDDYVDVWKYPFGPTDHRLHIVASTPSFTRSEFLSVGDISGDGRDDIVIANRSGSSVYLMQQPTGWSGTWLGTTKTIIGQASDIEVTDLLGTGRADLVFANAADVSGNSQVLIYQNTGSGLGSLPYSILPTSLGLGSIAVGDMSAIPGSDILTICVSSSNASAFFQSSSHAFSSTPDVRFPLDLNPLKAVVDRSMTGSEGVLILSQGMSSQQSCITYYYSDDDLLGNADDYIFSGTKQPDTIGIGRLSNGNAVLAAVLTSTDEVMIYEQDSSRTRILKTQDGPIALCWGKFDLDNNDDLAVLNSLTASVSVYSGANIFTTTYPANNITLSIIGASNIASGSVREDGYDDLFVTHSTGALVLYNTKDSLYFSPGNMEALGTGIIGQRSVVMVSDFDGDGIASDAAILNEQVDTVEIYLRNSTGSISEYYPLAPRATIVRTGEQFIDVTVGDFGGDAKDDIAILAQGGKVLFFIQPVLGFKDYIFTDMDATIILQNDALRISSGDVNDDGFGDALIGLSNSSQMIVLLRSGSAAFASQFNFTTGAVPSDILAGDINGDGRLDLMSTSGSSHSLCLWFQHNLAPLANATASDYSENEGTDITFNGSASTDSFSDRGTLNYTWTFEAGIIRYGSEVTYSYTSNGTRIASLKVTDRSGLSSWSNITLHIVDRSPIASFTSAPTNPFEGATVLFTDTSASSPDLIVNWTWNFGDLSPSKYARNPTHTYSFNGTFGVVLQVRDSDGSTSSYLGSVVVRDTAPSVSFTQSSSIIVEGESIDFLSTSTVVYDAIVNYTWNFDDGSFGYVSSITHTFIQNGTYHVSLTIRDSDGSTSSTSTTIQVQDTTPTANFDFSPNNAPEGSSVSFIDTSTGYDTLANWTWDFGDGSYGYGADVGHVFLDDGGYLVTLTVRDSDGSTDSASKTVSALDTSPVASYLFEPNPPVEGVQINFTSTSASFDPLVNWTWDIGMVKRYGPSVSYEFPNSGSYTVKLTVRDSDGSASSHSKSLVVSEAGLDTNFTIEPFSILEGTLVHFNDTSFSPVDPLVNWDWGFGDGSAGSGPNATHTYTRSGTFLVNLTVTDSDGSLGFKQKSVTVIEVVPVPSFTIEPTEVNEGQLVFFNATATTFDPITSWSWRFSDGHRSILQNESRAFGDGWQWANLTVRDSDGTANYLNLTFVVVDSAPISSFDIGAAVEGQSTSFTDTSTKSWEDIVIWYWDFGDSSPINYSKNPVHTYLMGGSYRVNHTVWDTDGNSNSALIWIDVERVLPRVSFTIAGSKVEGQTLLFTSNSQSYNQITSIDWGFDDGSHLSGGEEMAQVEKAYAAQGRYNVTLTIREADGDVNSSTVLIFVQDTSPTISSFHTIGGGTRFSEYDQVWFQITAVPSHDPLFSYGWDFEGTGVYIPSDPLLANISSYRYTQSGVYLAKAMVQDSDGPKVYSLSFQIVVEDVPPVAKLTWHNDTLVSGMVWFNASTSTDTPNDLGTLRYRWDFGDGNGTSYNYNYLVSHTFMEDGTFTVTLIVKDNDDVESAPATIRIVVDRMVPEVIMEQDGMNATVGEPIHIAAKVTDPGSGVKSVTLLFRIGDGPNQSMPMTPSQSPNLYTAVIAARENATTITYRIVVEDNANNQKSTQEFTIQVAQPNDLTTLIAVGILAAVILILVGFLIGRQSMAVDEVFIIYQDGRLMAHQTRRLKPGMDDEILSSMLVAIQSFVKDSFKDESSTHLQRLDFGEKKILVERGDSFYLAVVLHSNRAGNVPKRMQAVIEDIHKDFGASLHDWDGDLEKVRGIKDRADRLFKTSIPLAIADTRKPKAESSECPMCGFPIKPSDSSCPSCGTELSMSTVDDLETVAKDLEKEKVGKV